MATKAAPYADMFKVFGDFKMPGFDYNAIFAIQRRNIEAFSAANQVVTEGVQAVARRNVEIFKNNIEESISATRDLFTSNTPETGAAKQADLAKTMFEKTLGHVREVTEMASKSNIEAMDVLNKRMVESMEEISRISKAA